MLFQTGQQRVRPGIGVLMFMLGVILAPVAFPGSAAGDNEAARVRVLTLNGAIGPATADYLVRGIEQAATDQADLVVLQMDTPGGLMESMRKVISTILASPVPVATYVSPAGARAASAGTYILYGSQVAAMAPTTHLGSATPVQMGGLPGLPDDKPGDSRNPVPEQTTPAKPADADGSSTSAPENDATTNDGPSNTPRGQSPMERKVLEDAVSYIRQLAKRYHRNADWAERAVREAVNLGAEEALQKQVIDVVASDLRDLLTQLDGRTVIMADGTRTLHLRNPTIQRIDPDWRTELLSVITDPNVAYFLMIIGFYGLIFELASPGNLFPGVIGGICLVLALFAFQILSVNYAGLALILLGLSFIVGEAFMPSFGILGVGGIIAFIVGSIILMDGSHQAISLPVIGGTAAVAGGFILWTVLRFMTLRRQPPVSGMDQLTGEPAVALDDFLLSEGSYVGHISLTGERWNAVSNQPVTAGDLLQVTAVNGLTAEVKAAGNGSAMAEHWRTELNKKE